MNAPHRPAFAAWLSETNDITRQFLAAGRIPGMINLAGGLPAAEIFPTEELAQIAAKVTRDHPEETLGYGPLDGLPDLRDAIAARHSGPDLTLGRENVLITTAGMQGLDLVGKVLLDQGGLIAGQSPTYLGALDAWRPRHPRYRPMRLEENGFDPVAALNGAQFGYTVPNYSNPTGRLVGLSQREALVAATHETGTWLVEDDPYGTLHYDAPPLPRLIDLSGATQGGGIYRGPVIYLGTLSKELAPGLRLGWVIAAPEMIEAMTMAKQGSDMCTSGLIQRIVIEALATGLVDRVQPMFRDIYRTRRDALCAAMDVHLKGAFDWEVPVGGMFVWAVARDPGFDTNDLLPVALKERVCISPGSVFDPLGQDHRAMRINFTYNPPDKIAEGVRRLAVAVQSQQATMAA